MIPVLLCVAWTFFPSEAGADTIGWPPPGSSTPLTKRSVGVVVPDHPLSAPRADATPGGALRSLVVPGWGQWAAGKSHWWAYAAIEAVAWGGNLHSRREGGRFRREYRDLAWEAARSVVWDGPRVDGSFSYYERMGQWRASGRFDRSPEHPGIDPETDEATYNGHIWRLARDLHFPASVAAPGPGDPAWERALEFYFRRAIPPELAWAWGDQEGAQLRFRGLIRSSDEAFRRGTTFLGVTLLNRFVSGVEMWVASHPGPLEAVPLRLQAQVVPLPEEGGWGLHFRLLPRPSARGQGGRVR
jgi:hypothetical protein